ncbi:hypothetical protein NP603_20885 [Methylomonas sp. SURF-1]|uniref:Uncharacterized protein n=1 Tax=Methylomonas aurea TaxID=2952224 RepID=A0ABT1UQ80_9GAMM|nr:hypothetical protein [Methylomonas sp. SURF-1]MCQ8183576.1 hypothetical protein [Methylomonas sp. SURF-1]
MSKKPCSHDWLAATEFGRAQICRECGVVHLHVQNLTMRFEVADFLGLADTLAEAAIQARTGGKAGAQCAGFTLIKPSRLLN